MVTSPLLATICARPSTSVTWNSVHALPAGFTVKSPALVANPLEVAIRTAPCSISTAGPSYFTRESAKTITFDPVELIFAVASECVCTRSPANTAVDFGTAPPFSQVWPLAYNIAEAELESAASNCAGTNMASRQLKAHRNIDRRIAQLAPKSLGVAQS